MQEIDLLWVFVAVFAIDSLVPGPAVAMVMSRGASIGFVRTLPFIAGLVIGDLFLFLLALLGVVVLAQTLGPLFLVVKWLGVLYLIYLAYVSWNTPTFEITQEQVKGAGIRSFVLALLLPLGNPKAVGFYVALLPAFLDVKTLSFTTAIHFSIAIVVIWAAILAGYTALADFGRRFFNDSALRTLLNRGAAAAMVGVAGTIALRD